MNVVIRDTTRHQAFGRAGAVEFAGYTIHASAFDAGQLDRLVHRALDEGVRLTATEQPGVYLAKRPGSPATYRTTRTGCTCPAGQRGRPCKHRALVALHLAVTRPRAP